MMVATVDRASDDMAASMENAFIKVANSVPPGWVCAGSAQGLSYAPSAHTLCSVGSAEIA